MSTTITKMQVAAKCLRLLQQQMQRSNHPTMRQRLQKHIDHLTCLGILDEYQLVVYQTSIELLADDYENEPNYKLHSDGSMEAGRYDDELKLHDAETLRLHADGSADSGRANHGHMTGECITHNRVFEKGREKHFGYQNFGNDGSGLQGHEVNNDPDASILQRLLKNETLTGWEFFVGLLLILLAMGICSAISIKLLGTESLMPLFGGATVGGYVWLVSRRVADMNCFGGKRILFTLLALLTSTLGLLVLLFFPSKVHTARERRFNDRQHSQRAAQVRQILNARSHSFTGDLPWFRLNAAEMSIISALQSGQGIDIPAGPAPAVDPTASPFATGGSSSHGSRADDDDDGEEQRRQEREREISYLESQLSSVESSQRQAENDAQRARQQGDTYMSYARSESDESRARDYESSADRCYDEARSYESDASRYASEASDLRSQIYNLRYC